MSACLYAAQQLASRHVSARHPSCIQHTVICYRSYDCSWPQTCSTQIHVHEIFVEYYMHLGFVWCWENDRWHTRHKYMYVRYVWSITCTSGSCGVEKIEMFAVRAYHPKINDECPHTWLVFWTFYIVVQEPMSGILQRLSFACHSRQLSLCTGAVSTDWTNRSVKLTDHYNLLFTFANQLSFTSTATHPASSLTI
jgi:hypothetical protein